jgi:catechol 2,3-dioxygenase-like lactoylglutathione lyase family enzyme
MVNVPLRTHSLRTTDYRLLVTDYRLLTTRYCFMTHLMHIALVVADYDEAIAWYTQKLGFKLIEDTVLSDVKRWVLVQPSGEGSCQLLLAKAATDEQKSRVGNQTGGRVFLFLHTDDFEKDHANLIAQGITIVRGPSEEEYGKVLVFEDLYGNLWDLIG